MQKDKTPPFSVLFPVFTKMLFSLYVFIISKNLRFTSHIQRSTVWFKIQSIYETTIAVYSVLYIRRARRAAKKAQTLKYDTMCMLWRLDRISIQNMQTTRSFAVNSELATDYELTI